jgi:hypothetical protein
VKLLPGSYKSGRRTWRGRKIIVTCAKCDWQSRLASPQKAEQAYVRHIATVHDDMKATELSSSCSKQDG